MIPEAVACIKAKGLNNLALFSRAATSEVAFETKIVAPFLAGTQVSGGNFKAPEGTDPDALLASMLVAWDDAKAARAAALAPTAVGGGRFVAAAQPPLASVADERVPKTLKAAAHIS